jgi:quinolinate synthase
MSLPDSYLELHDDVVTERIVRAKAQLGRHVTILGHHYQRDAVIRHADYRGDSLDLSRRAAESRHAHHIVFCGVTFMAETAAILCTPEQTVVQPAREASCPMAEMASGEDAEIALHALGTLFGGDLVPLTYQNSTADVKAVVGRHEGAVCTSSNARALFEWAFARAGHILFLPDEHLGTNTALSMGIPDEQIAVWDPARPADPATLKDARVIVWRGFCNVHVRMLPEDVDAARAQLPDCKVIVHPECTRQVVAKADTTGSTTGIIHYVEQAPAGSAIVVGTEVNLVDRLAAEHPDKTILPLCRARCRTMSMTTERHLLYVLDGLLEGEPRNVIEVDPQTSRWAQVALERMLVAR